MKFPNAEPHCFPFVVLFSYKSKHETLRRHCCHAAKPQEVKLSQVRNTEGLTNEEIINELNNGAKFVYFSYVISALVITFTRSSDVYFIRSGESPLKHGWPYLLITLFLGWWGIPHGLIRTPIALVKDFNGGTDVTEAYRAYYQSSQAAPAAAPDSEAVPAQD